MQLITRLGWLVQKTTKRKLLEADHPSQTNEVRASKIANEAISVSFQTSD
jgi:hypothetical protein